jgi:hypothetical protein
MKISFGIMGYVASGWKIIKKQFNASIGLLNNAIIARKKQNSQGK